MTECLARRQWVVVSLCGFIGFALCAEETLATIYDFEPDGQEYAGGDILGKNPLFTPGGIRNIKQFNDLYRTSNGLVVDEFKVGAGDPNGLTLGRDFWVTWEVDNPVIPTWVNARDGFKFPAGTALAGEFATGGLVGETVTFRAYSYPVRSGLYTEMEKLPFVDERTLVIEGNGSPMPFRIDSLSADARSFAAFRITPEGKYLPFQNPTNVTKIELTTVVDTTPPPYRSSPTYFDFANVGESYPVDGYVLGDQGEEGLAKVNAAHSSSHGLHDEEFVLDHPDGTVFRVSGQTQNGYPKRWMVNPGSAGHISWWANAKDGFVFPKDGSIGVTNFNPGWTSFDNGNQPVEVIIRAYAEPIVTGSFEELAGLTLVGEAKRFGNGTFNTPPMLELLANAKSFTAHTGDGHGNFVTFLRGDGSFASTIVNNMIVETVPEPPAGLPGDYNGDTKVDAADYTTFRDSVGLSTLTNRGPGISGLVGAADFAFWKAHFGDGSGSGATALAGVANVPEPNSLVAVALAALTITICRRRCLNRIACHTAPIRGNLSEAPTESNMIKSFKHLAAVALCLALANVTTSNAESTLEKTTVTYREVNGHKILVDVYRPPGDKVCPVIIWLHGGALIMGNREGIHHELMNLAEENGYAVVSFDYRLAPESKLPELINDLEAGYQWLMHDGVKQFHLDPYRIVVAGGSAGGYLSLTTGYRFEPKPKGIIALYGYGSLNSDWYAEPSPHPCHNGSKFTRQDAEEQTDGTVISDDRERKGDGVEIYLYYRQQGIWPEKVSGFDPATLAEDLIPYEPIRNVVADYPPTLLIHGTLDTDVPFEESENFAAALKRQGVPHTLIAIENGEHGLNGGDPEKIEAAHQAMRQFVIDRFNGK